MFKNINDQINLARRLQVSLNKSQKNTQVGLYIEAVAHLRPMRGSSGKIVQSPQSADLLTKAFPSILAEKTDTVALRLNHLVVFKQLQHESVNAHPLICRIVTDALVNNWNLANKPGTKSVTTMEVDLAGASSKTSKDYGLKLNDAESLIAGLNNLGTIDGEAPKPIVFFGPVQADADKCKATVARNALKFLLKHSDLPHPGSSMLKKDIFTPWLVRKLGLYLSNNVRHKGTGLTFVFSCSATPRYVPENWPEDSLEQGVAITPDVAAFITHNHLGEFSNGKLVLFLESIKPH